MGFMDLEEAYDRVNREDLWQVLKIYDDEQGDFRSGRECVDQIFTLKHIGEKEG